MKKIICLPILFFLLYCSHPRILTLRDTKFHVGDVIIIHHYIWEENSIPEYDSIITILKNNPKMIIEVSVNSDFRASEEYNKRYTQEVADRFKAYLIDKGIDSLRITAAIGYGENNPRKLTNDIIINKIYNFPKGTILTEEYIVNLPNINYKEEAHRLNRRIEVKIIKNNYISD